MKIISLIAENFKKIKAIEIRPAGGVVQVTGKNAAGKTSVLDSILAVFGGADGLPEKALREGAEKGKIVVDVGDFTVKRTITKGGGGTLSVESKDGFVKKSPQKFLDEIVGKVSFDPLEFVRRDPKDQADILRKLVGADTTAIDKEIKTIYDGRTEIGTRLRIAKGEFASLVLDESVKPGTEPIDVKATAEELKKVRELEKSQEMNRNKLRENDKLKLDHLEAIESNEQEIKLLSEKIGDLNRNIDDLKKTIEKISERAADIGEEIERLEIGIGGHEAAALLEDRIESAAAVNMAIDNNRRFQESKVKVDGLEAVYKIESEKIDAKTAEKTAILTSAKFPIDGLEFGEDALLYKGIPLSQVAESEKIKVGVAVSMALNPRLRVIRIMDGSLLDSDSMKAISEMAQDKDFQIWIERVDESGKVGIFIEDGEIKEGGK